jgi:integrase
MKANPKTNINSSDKTTEEWLNSQKKATRVTYQSLWGYFLEFTGLTGDQILDNKKADKTYTWEKKVMEFKDWLIKKGLSEKSAKTATATVRGFFSYYRLPLQFRRSESGKLSEAEPKYEDYRFAREDLKKMCDVADLNERYVITAGKSFGLRAGDFLKLTRGDIEPYINREPPICIGPIDTQKESVRAYPFVDSDAQPVIKLMLEQMDREGRTDPNQRILKYTNEIQLSRILQRVADKAGMKHGSKRVRFHCLRKFLIDRLSSHMSESKWKQIIGKKISESAYVSPDSLREDYQRAMKETTFAITDLIELQRRQEASERIQSKLIAGESLNEEDRADMKRFNLRLLERAHKPKTATNGGDCGEVFEQIPETDLLAYLRQGWTLIHRLQSGDVIMRKS